MSNKPLIKISLNFGNTTVPVINCEDGHERVPLKPIVDEIGVQWEGQREKVQPDKELGSRLGTLVLVVDWTDIRIKKGSPLYLCIRIDRVAAFLSSINPVQVRAHKNISSADWLEFWRREWDAVLDAYNSHPIQLERVKKKKLLASAARLKKQTKNVNDRDVLDRILISVAKDTGVNLQTGNIQ